MINSLLLVWKEPQRAAVLTAGGSDMKVMQIKAHESSWWEKQMVRNDSHLLWESWVLLKCLKCPYFMLIPWRLLRIWEKQRSWLVALHRHWGGGWGLLGPWRPLLLSQGHWHCVGWWELSWHIPRLNIHIQPHSAQICDLNSLPQLLCSLAHCEILNPSNVWLI